MKHLLLALVLLGFPVAALADDPPPPECGLAAGLLVTQDNGTVTLACTGITPEFGLQLAALMTQVLQRRLDPEAVVAKLDEIGSMPKSGAARELDVRQREAIIASLVGKPPQEIAVAAHPAAADAVAYGTSIVMPLTMVGWQIAGSHITRKTSPVLDGVHGIAVVVRDPAAAPDKAKQLRAALSAAHIPAPIVADPGLAADAAVLWVGQRPEFGAAPKS